MRRQVSEAEIEEYEPDDDVASIRDERVLLREADPQDEQHRGDETGPPSEREQQRHDSHEQISRSKESWGVPAEEGEGWREAFLGH